MKTIKSKDIITLEKVINEINQMGQKRILCVITENKRIGNNEELIFTER